VKEPEAAALFTTHHMSGKGLTPGDAVIICDAGGGTVDLITYEVISLKPFELKEIVAANGE
jgi:molecular chaperone DnaK (HSP70)